MLRDCFDSWYLNHTKFRFLGPATSTEIEKLQMCPTLDSFRKPEEQLAYLISSADDGKVYLAVIKNLIVGYVALNKAEESSSLSLPGVLELTALEVSKYYRNYSLATCLMNAIKQDNTLEKYILVAHETNIKKCTSPEASRYRKVIVKLLHTGNFTHMPPDNALEPLKDNQLFMVKVGSKVPPDILCYFKAIRNSLT